MAGKGRKRREKNYRAAHGDKNLLPPPPDHSALSALPSKLRQIMSFAKEGSMKDVQSTEKKSKRRDDARNNNQPETNVISKSCGVTDHNDHEFSTLQSADNSNENVNINSTEQKKKRKRKQVDDLRFQDEIEKLGVVSKRRERKKEYLKEKKKKKKHKKANPEENLDMPKHDKIKFGEVVEAPPKLSVVPKVPKKSMDASQERLRIQAIEAYRNRKKWTSRPGIDIPATVMESQSML